MPRSHAKRQGLAREERVSRRLLPVMLGTVLVLVTFAVYWPAISAGFLWDDDTQLYANPLILARDGLYRFWFTTTAIDYWPMTSTMLWLEWRIWGKNPLPYHLGNILLHAVAAVLLWRVLRRLTVREPGAFLAGLIFAVHPVAVESVAWIAERKNVLSMVLYLLSILAYLRFEDDRRQRWYVFALLAGAAAMLAKSSVVTLPVVLLLCAWWKRGRITRQDVLRTLPLFVLSLVLGLVGIWSQQPKAVAGVPFRPAGLTSKIAASGWVVWFYLYKLLVPIHLATIYSHWRVDGGRVLSFVPLGLLLVCLAVLWGYRKRWARAPLAALGYFVITLGPVLGLIDMSFAQFSQVADHLQYVSMIGVIALISGLLTLPLSQPGARRWGLTQGARLAAVCVVVFTLGTLTWRQTRVYKNEENLWAHTIQLNDRAWIAYDARGNTYADRHAFPQAIADYTRAVELRPDDSGAWYNRALARAQIGDYTGTIADCSKAIKLEPTLAEAYNNRANAYVALKLYDRALSDYTQAIKLRPEADYYVNRGDAYAALRQGEQAIMDYTQGIKLKPDAASVYSKRAIAYYNLRQYRHAWADVQTCKRLGGSPPPDFVEDLKHALGQSEQR